MMRRHQPLSVLPIGLLLLGACAADHIIPRAVEDQVDKTMTFTDLLQDPERYRGRVVELGGKVLAVEAGQQESRLEVLHLPLDGFHLPRAPLSDSQGRFVAVEKRFVDPALFPDGTRVTVVGEVVGTRRDRIGALSYTYPVIEIRYLRIWEVVRPYSWPGRRPWSRPWAGSTNFQPKHTGWF